MRRLFDKWLDMEALPEDRQLPDTTGKLFWHFVRQRPGGWLVLGVISAMTAVANALLPIFFGQLMDVAERGGEAMATAGTITAIICGLVVARLVFDSSFYTVNGLWIMPRFGNMIRRQTHWYVLRHSLSYFNSDFAGRIANKVVQMGPAIRDVLQEAIGSIWYVIIFFVTAMAYLSHADRVLLWPFLFWIVSYIIILCLTLPQIQKRSLRHSDSQSNMVGRIVDSYTNILTVKLFAQKEHEDEFVMDSLRRHRKTMYHKNVAVAALQYAHSVIDMVFLISTILLSVHLWQSGQISAGVVAAALPLALQITNMSGWIAGVTTTLFEQIGTIQESMETVAKPLKVQDAPQAVQLQVSRGHIRFENVAFHYDNRDMPVIENLNLDVPGGQKLGIVGRSGAGKSTLVGMLLRFHDLERGRITIDGQDIAGHTQDSLRSQVAVVTQDTSLLHRSILENIGYGSPHASMDEIIEAARKAQAHDFIAGLSDHRGRVGYDAHVGERGVKLSGGQRQRIALARAILKNAPILVLDEATSALDSEVEADIQEALYQLMEGKTVLAIAHRLSTIARMDRLIIMDHGRIIEDGSHAALLEKGGHYAHLWSLQSGGFIGE